MGTRDFGAGRLRETGASRDPEHELASARHVAQGPPEAHEETAGSDDATPTGRPQPAESPLVHDEREGSPNRSEVTRAEPEGAREPDQNPGQPALDSHRSGRAHARRGGFVLPFIKPNKGTRSQDSTDQKIAPSKHAGASREQLNELRDRNEKLRDQIVVQRQREEKLHAREERLRRREEKLNRELTTTLARLTSSAEQIAKLKTSLQEQRAQLARANERTAQLKDQMNQRLSTSAEQIANLKASLQDQRAQLARANERTAQLKDQMNQRLSTSAEQIAKLKASLQEQRAQLARANERTAQLKDLMNQRVSASKAQLAKLAGSVREQRSRVVQANERTTQVKATMDERTRLYRDRLATSRETIAQKTATYNAARRYIGIYRQGLIFDEVAKSDVDFAADAYLCLLPSSVPAGLALSRLKGGRVFCDCVENVEVHKHSLAPRVHQPALELINAAATGSLMAADGILTVGNALATTLERFGPPVHVLPNFRRFEQPTPANELRAACGLKPDDRLLFASGNVVVGFEPVVRAMAALPSNVHLAAFVRLKPADYEATVKQEIADLGLSDRIHFFDFVEYSRLASLAADADVGLITSDTSNPNGAVALPNRLFDYLTAGLPVIAPPMPDVVDIIRKHGFGKTLEQVTATNWAEAITEVLHHRDAFKQAALRARQELTWESGEDELVSFLGNPRSVTLIGFRDLSRYQRFLRVAQTLTSRGIKVKALFLSADPAPVSIPGAEFYHFSDRYGLGDGPIQVRHEG
ncbi:hypothetical protein GCM10011512_16080 [Tersicoccus solisilvae]|uniref:Glycosyl transferase family 1 domain-containing protein n=1 Tax=Tersicoccus solisilvae TaxID=1882339 RepID=A0ABQ1P6L7_9MICC|nr:glycosyltransferase [Tersicoccus solisilvae]GGC89914.1 hypothetical protein GCM10011512_16080 [Tersicoccus solisilvae]